MKITLKKRSILLISIIFAILAIVLIFVLVLFSIPKSYDELEVNLGCVTIDNTDIQFSPYIIKLKKERHSESAGQNSTWYFKWVSFVLKTVKLTETEDIPTDAQISEIKFSSDGVEQHAVTYAYDFYQKQVYALKNGKWYEAKNTRLLDKLIVSLYDEALNTNSSTWRGQSTFVPEEFVFYNKHGYAPQYMDFENATFRYNLYWKPTSRPRDAKDHTTQGFNITEASKITTREQAMQLAAKEMGYSNYIATALYDVTCNYWMVEIVNADNFDGLLNDENTFYLHDNTYTIIINDNGIIKEKYQAITVFTPFLNKYW